jgi:hypothetical protein
MRMCPMMCLAATRDFDLIRDKDVFSSSIAVRIQATVVSILLIATLSSAVQAQGVENIPGVFSAI